MTDRMDVSTALSATRQSLQLDMGATQFSASSRPITASAPGSPAKAFDMSRGRTTENTGEAKAENITRPSKQKSALEKSPYLAGVFKDDNIAKLIRKRLSLSFNKRSKS